MSRSSDASGDSPTDEKSNGAKSPTRNGTIGRPGYDRTDTGASGWATDTEGEEKVWQSPYMQQQPTRYSIA